MNPRMKIEITQYLWVHIQYTYSYSKNILNISIYISIHSSIHSNASSQTILWFLFKHQHFGFQCPSTLPQYHEGSCQHSITIFIFRLSCRMSIREWLQHLWVCSCLALYPLMVKPVFVVDFGKLVNMYQSWVVVFGMRFSCYMSIYLI